MNQKKRSLCERFWNTFKTNMKQQQQKKQYTAYWLFWFLQSSFNILFFPLAIKLSPAGNVMSNGLFLSNHTSEPMLTAVWPQDQLLYPI